MKADLRRILEEITDATSIATVLSSVDDAISDYVHDGWEDEFEDIHEAYLETGRGQAETNVVADLIKVWCDAVGLELTDDQFCDLHDLVVEHYGLCI